MNSETELKILKAAKCKVRSNPQLAPHEDFILADWPNTEEHYAWLLGASVAEILDWVEVCAK